METYKSITENEIRCFFLDLSDKEINNSIYLSNVNFAITPLSEIMDRVILLAEDLEQLYTRLYVTGVNPKYDNLDPLNIRELNKWDYFRKYNVFIKLVSNCYIYEELQKRISEKNIEPSYMKRI